MLLLKRMSYRYSHCLERCYRQYCFIALKKPFWKLCATIPLILNCVYLYVFVYMKRCCDSVRIYGYKETFGKQKRWAEYTEIHKKCLNDLDNHEVVITYLEPDILECEVKWALRSITTNKARRGDGIPAELFQILKDDAMKVLHSICQKIWKTQQWL